MSMKNSNDTIGNQTRGLPACSALPQPTALPHAPTLCRNVIYFVHICFSFFKLYIGIIPNIPHFQFWFLQIKLH
jgi:hypothetical protein